MQNLIRCKKYFDLWEKRSPLMVLLSAMVCVYYLFIYVLNFRLRVINCPWCNAIDFPALEVELNVHSSGVGHHGGGLKVWRKSKQRPLKLSGPCLPLISVTRGKAYCNPAHVHPGLNVPLMVPNGRLAISLAL